LASHHENQTDIALGLITLTLCVPAFAQGTAFTYQGRLNNGDGLANGSYDLRFALFDAVSAGTQLGGTLTNSRFGLRSVLLHDMSSLVLV